MAGKMRYRLRLLRPDSPKDNNFGGKVPVYVETKVVRAERKQISPRLVEELGELFSDYTVEYNIRDAHKVDVKWRVEELGGHTYMVENIIPNHDRGMLTLRCSRINK